MCGILTIVARPGRFKRAQVRQALDSLTHRGPDGWGLTQHRVDDWQVWLGHRRLAVVDLSPTGEQPMSAGKTHIVFNGEIYNHRDVRRDLLSDVAFRGSSDTEVLLRGLQAFGPDFVEHLNGMLAFACLDEPSHRVLLGRDRLGKKPLYVFQNSDMLVVASELKAIVELGVELAVNQAAWAFYRWMGYIPGPETIYQQVTKFPAASVATIDLSQKQLTLDTQRFWDPLASFGTPYQGTYQNALDDLQSLLDDATRIRLEADVPVGAFLSGGVDSTLVVSAISRVRPDIRSYTVKLGSASLDESSLAMETGRQLGVQVDLLTIDPKPDETLSWFYDEPFADISQIPTVAISAAAREHVTVVLTGDGGDELFLGYPWVEYPEMILGLRDQIPGPLSRTTAQMVDTPLGHRAVALASSIVGMNPATAEGKAKTVKDILGCPDVFALYDLFKMQRHRGFLSAHEQSQLLGSMADYAQSVNPDLDWSALAERTLPEFFGAVDLLLFLKDDVLVKVDRGTMAQSLEARAPLLDYRIVEFAHSIPLHFKISDGRHKRILRDLLSRTVKGDVLSRGKQGFGVPVPQGLPTAPTPSAAWAEYMANQWNARWCRYPNVHNGTGSS